MADKPVALVTGCTAGGIGHAIALRFCERGCEVYATARRPESVGQVPEGVHILPLDVTDRVSIDAAVAEIKKRSGRIDYLVNNAGRGFVGPVAELDIDEAKKAYDTNFFGMMAVIQAVVPTMAARRQGKIINVGSVVGFVSPPFSSVYSSSKAAVHSMSDALRLELRPFGIQVMVVAPGAIRSNFGSNASATIDTSRLDLYKPFKAQLEARAGASQQPKSTPAGEFARRVVAQATRRRVTRLFMSGHLVCMFKFLAAVPAWLRDRILLKKFGLNRPYDEINLNNTAPRKEKPA